MNENKLEILMQNKNLVNTSYDITAIQNRIFYYCLLSAQKEKNGCLCCTVQANDLKKFIPNKNQRTLSNLKKTLQILKGTSLLFEKEEKGDNIECDYNLIAGSEFNQRTEEFKIYFMERLYDHIIEYSVYAPLNLNIVSKFKSFYSQRLYELLRLWSRTGQTIIKEFSVENLRFILAVEDKYPEYKNFKQRVLNQAIKEINLMGNMQVKFEENKIGRKVEKIEFSILDNEPKIYFKKNNGSSNKVNIVPVDFSIKMKEASKAAIEYVNLPPDIFDKDCENEFINYCFNNSFSFNNNNDLLDILINSKEISLNKKEEIIIGKYNNTYNYFLGIFKNKVDELEKSYDREIKFNMDVFSK